MDDSQTMMGFASYVRRWVAVRSVRRTMYLVFLWSCMCYFVFRYTVKDQAFNFEDRPSLDRLLMQHNDVIRTVVSQTNATVVGVTTSSSEEHDVLVDKSPVLTEENMVAEVQRKVPNLPIAYWHKTKSNKHMYYKNSSCAKFPNMYELEFNSMYWQTLHSTNGTFHFYGAYYDNRPLNQLGPTVRILGMINRIEPKVSTFCQFWFPDNKEPVMVKNLEYKYIWYRKWGNYKQGIFQPYLLACQIPTGYKNQVPASVSLVERPCDTATNNLRVINNRPEKKGDFAVCVKGLDFLHEDLSVRLTEWIELLGILGADKVFLYDLQIHPNISKVLKYYESTGQVVLTPLTLPGGQPNIPGLQHLYLQSKINNKRQNELIPYNDCLYRNLYSYKYIALLDTDEVIMPTRRSNWKDLMSDVMTQALKIKKEARASYNVRNVYFLDDLLHDHGWFKDVPKYMHMLQHVYRSRNYTKPGQYVKCFHNPERVLTLHNHFPLACLSGQCTSYPINTSDAQLQHYRADCVKTLKNSCKTEYRVHSIMDTTIWRHKNELIRRVTNTLGKLGFLVSPTVDNGSSR